MYIALWSFILRKLLTNEYRFLLHQSVVIFYVFKFCLQYPEHNIMKYAMSLKSLNYFKSVNLKTASKLTERYVFLTIWETYLRYASGRYMCHSVGSNLLWL